ncbi:MAG TPA: ergothioneine biosynthesis glutamate--cysteine ligase EgtA [Streptosporangiaceae bacterium]|jgi:glutamate--cysteine ligase
MMHLGAREDDPAPPLSERDAEHRVHGICFKTGPPGALGVELEWLVCDRIDPVQPVSHDDVRQHLAPFDTPGSLPGNGRLTVEPGGQVELSSAPAAVGDCVAAACRDLAAMRAALRPAGLTLVGHGIDPYRPPSRVLDLPRYAAMEAFFDRGGHWGRLMMCSTASVQVCVDAGQDRQGQAGYRYRWRLLHAIGPILVATFANSPLRAGRPTGWKSTRQLVWARLDPTRTRAPAGAEPAAAGRPGADPDRLDPRGEWARYALDAKVMCVRRDGSRHWTAPAGMTFRDWLRGGGERRPTGADLDYHLSTLFPPVRPQGHLEVRVIDAQPADGWIVPAALVAALADDPVAADTAMAAAEQVWHGRCLREGSSPWPDAARLGPADPVLARAGQACFEAAESALSRAGTPAPIRHALTSFADRYISRGRCPADDMLEEIR